MSHISYVNGRYLPHQSASVHIDDRGYQFADGVYEVICIWNGYPVDYAPHMVRLKRSLSELQIRLPMPVPAMTAVIREVVERNRIRKGTIYLQVGRGVAPRNHPFPPASVKPSLVVVGRHGTGPSDAAAEHGVKVITAPDNRWERVDIKSVGLLPNVMVKERAAEAKAYEALLYLDNGVITEASSSNAWLVTPDKTILTHPPGGILVGITRQTLIRIARAAGYKVEERPFTLKDTETAKEVFLSGTTTFVMPVVQIDDRPVANGAAGTVALDLRGRYRAYVDGIDPAAAWTA